MRNSQRSILNFLLNTNRFTRLVEQNALDDSAYKPTEFLTDLREGIWAELSDQAVSTDAFRRNLQRLYLDLIDNRLNRDDAQWNDMRALLRGQLRTLDTAVEASLARAGDDATLFHLQDVRNEIAAILDPEIYRAGLIANQGNGFDEAPDPFDPYIVHGCWVDFLIHP